MPIIKNRLYQPLTIHIHGERGNLHLLPRQRITIAQAEISAELQSAAERGLVIIEQDNPAQPTVTPKTANRRESGKATSRPARSNRRKRSV